MLGFEFMLASEKIGSAPNAAISAFANPVALPSSQINTSCTTLVDQP